MYTACTYYAYIHDTSIAYSCSMPMDIHGHIYIHINPLFLKKYISIHESHPDWTWKKVEIQSIYVCIHQKSIYVCVIAVHTEILGWHPPLANHLCMICDAGRAEILTVAFIDHELHDASNHRAVDPLLFSHTLPSVLLMLFSSSPSRVTKKRKKEKGKYKNPGSSNCKRSRWWSWNPDSVGPFNRTFDSHSSIQTQRRYSKLFFISSSKKKNNSSLSLSLLLSISWLKL